MILETLPEVCSMNQEEKSLLAHELLEELRESELTEEQEAAILKLLESRHQKHLDGNDPGKPWEEVRDGLRDKTGGSWGK